MKNIKTFMLSTVAAVCLTTGVAAAEGNAYSQPNEQQREYRTPLREMERNDANQIRNRDYQNQGAYYDDERQYRANNNDMRSDKAGYDIRWGATTNQQARLSAGELQQVQRRLRDAGHSISVDGIWGPETAGAVREFQQERDLAVTGKLDSQTLSELDVSTTVINRDNR